MNKKKGLLALLVAMLVGLALFVGTQSVTSAAGGMTMPRAAQDLGNGVEGVSGGTVNQTVTLDSGTMDLVATGTSMKTLIVGGNGCGNAWMSWDDSPAGSAYKVTRRSSWNANGTCGGEVLNSPKLEMWTPSGDYSDHGLLTDGETDFNEIDDVGSSTTKFSWGNIDADWADVNVWYCAYLIPGGGGYWSSGGCSV